MDVVLSWSNVIDNIMASILTWGSLRLVNNNCI
jgi:hypothetical protein